MTQNQKNQGNIDLANMLRLFAQENCQSEEADDYLEGSITGCKYSSFAWLDGGNCPPILFLHAAS